MRAKLFLYALGIWFVFVVVAVLNGTFRNLFLEPRIGKYAGHVISTIILISSILLVTFLFLRSLKAKYSRADLLLIGLFWAFLTSMFEFLFGHYVIGNPWEVLFADYNIFKGRLWSLVLVTEFFAPSIFGSILYRS